MISIILACSEETKKRALSDGFKEETVLIKMQATFSSAANKAMLENEIVQKFRPYQFLVGDFWGMGSE